MNWRLLMLAIIIALLISTDCHAAVRYNAFLMGDSIIDNYPHSANGLAYYMRKDSGFNVVCDYSYEGKTICNGMQKQTTKVIARLRKYKGKRKVVVFSFGSNDYFKKCKGNHFKVYEKCIKQIRKADSKAKIIAVVPTHIYRVRNDKQIKTIYGYSTKTKYLKKNIISIYTNKYLSSSDIKYDCLHFTSGGYKKTVIQIKKVLGV